MQKIAFIDDDNNILESLKWLFNDEPYRIFTFNNPDKAFDEITVNEFAVVVSDLLMPEIEGTKLLHKIKKKWPETECIIMTVHSPKENEDTGNFQIIAKPWNINEVKQIIRDAVARYEKTYLKQKDMQAKKKNILYVENNSGMAQVMMKTLKALGYETTLATRSKEAITLMQAQPDLFDIIITDKNLTEINGPELSNELKKINPDTPVILCTGDGNIDSEEIKRTTGIMEVLFKPFTKNELREMLNRVE